MKTSEAGTVRDDNTYTVEFVTNCSPVKPIDEEQTEEEKKIISTKREKTSLLAIAYYNAGSQLEFLKSYRECIDSFNRAISTLERNFAPNYPLTLEFKKTLSKAIQKYQTHISWKGNNRTFSNLNETLVSKRVGSSLTRPTSETNTAKPRTQPMQGRFRSISKNARPFTAKSKQATLKSKLNDSLNNPFGSPEGEECLFSLEEKPREEASIIQNDEKVREINSGVMSILDKHVEPERNGTISPIFGHAKRFKRPQSAKSAFVNMNKLRKKPDAQEYATLELKKIFAKNEDLTIKESVKSISRLSKPPINRCVNHKKPRPTMKNHNQYDSLLNMYNSEVDPRTTMSSLNTKRQFNFTSRFPSNAVKTTSRGPRYGLQAYKSIDVRKPQLRSKKQKRKCIRPLTAKFNPPRFKTFVQQAESLREIKKQIMDDNNYTVNLMFRAKGINA